jgi:uncharacterized protein YbjT (DUF2867 family)
MVVTAAGGPTGTAVVRALRARGEPVRAVLIGARLGRAPRSYADHLADLPLGRAA